MTEPEAPEPTPEVEQAPTEQPEQPKTFDESYVKKLRDEAAANRVKANEAETRHQQMLDAIAKSLGLKDDDKPDADALTQQLTASQAEAKRLKVAYAVEKAARSNEADEDLTVAVLAHQGKLAGLDPASDGFADAVAELVKATVDANPRLKTAPPTPGGAGRSGGDFSGGPTPPPASLSSQIAAAKKAGNVHEVIRLENLKLADGGQ
jgi:hypothetical protein